VNIYIVAQVLGRAATPDLTKFLSRIEVAASMTIPVIAVDQLYNLPQLAQKSNCLIAGHDIAKFSLDDFRDPRQQASLDRFTVDINLLAHQLDNATSSWIVIDFEQHLKMNILDFIRKLGDYIFISKNIEHKNIVLLAQDHHVPYFSRCVNQSVNNLSISPLEVKASGQVMEYLSLRIGFGMRVLPRFIVGPLLLIWRLLARAAPSLQRTDKDTNITDLKRPRSSSV